MFQTTNHIFTMFHLPIIVVPIIWKIKFDGNQTTHQMELIGNKIKLKRVAITAEGPIAFSKGSQRKNWRS